MEKKAIDFLNELINSNLEIKFPTINKQGKFKEKGSEIEHTEIHVTIFDGLKCYTFSLVPDCRRLTFTIAVKQSKLMYYFNTVYTVTSKISFAEVDFVNNWIDALEESTKFNAIQSFTDFISGNFEEIKEL